MVEWFKKRFVQGAVYCVPAELFDMAVVEAGSPMPTETPEMRTMIELIAGGLPLPDLSGARFFRVINAKPESHVFVDQATAPKRSDVIEVQVLDAIPGDIAGEMCLASGTDQCTSLALSVWCGVEVWEKVFSHVAMWEPSADGMREVGLVPSARPPYRNFALPPTVASRSKRSTSTPLWHSACAAPKPAIPPPTIATRWGADFGGVRQKNERI